MHVSLSPKPFSGKYTMDVLDAISFLRLAFSRGLTGEDKALVIVIMGFACISLFVPVLALFNLVKSNFGAAQISKWVSMWHKIVYFSTYLSRPQGSLCGGKTN